MSDSRPIAYEEDGVAIYRASSLGHACIKALVAARLGYQPLPPPAHMQERFDEGTAMEPVVVGMMRDRGWEFEEGGFQAEYHIQVGAGAKVRMHLDGIARNSELVLPDRMNRWVTEIKAFGDAYWDKFLAGGIAAFPMYEWQTAIQMHATGLPLAFAVAHKETQELVVEYLEKPRVSLSDIKRKVVHAELIAKRGALPECDVAMYPCPYYFLCADSDDKPDAETDPVLDAAADFYDECRANERHWKQKKDEARARVMEVLDGRTEVRTGRFKVQLVKQERESVNKRMLKAEYPEVADKVTETKEIEMLNVDKAGK